MKLFSNKTTFLVKLRCAKQATGAAQAQAFAHCRVTTAVAPDDELRHYMAID